MIYLPDVAKAIEDILNNRFNNIDVENPTDFEFVVATTGFHLDNNLLRKEQKNFIPVFIDSLGGNYDAVKNVKRAVKNIPITLYFPVRFKNNFFSMDDFLVDVFVAEIIDFGGITGKGLCNISVPQYGEIQNLDLNQFYKWLNDVYSKPIERMEPYMSMTFTLYITTQKEGFVLGNNVSYKLRYSYTKTFMQTDTIKVENDDRVYSYDGEAVQEGYFRYTSNGATIFTQGNNAQEGDNYYYYAGSLVLGGKIESITESPTGETEKITKEQDLVWTSSGTGVSNSPISQQLIDVDTFTKSVINITNYNKSIVAYIEENDFWLTLLDFYNKQEFEKLDSFELIKTYNFESGIKEYTYNQIVISLNENVALGDILSMTITFGDKYEEGE